MGAITVSIRAAAMVRIGVLLALVGERGVPHQATSRRGFEVLLPRLFVFSRSLQKCAKIYLSGLC